MTSHGFSTAHPRPIFSSATHTSFQLAALLLSTLAHAFSSCSQVLFLLQNILLPFPAAPPPRGGGVSFHHCLFARLYIALPRGKHSFTKPIMWKHYRWIFPALLAPCYFYVHEKICTVESLDIRNHYKMKIHQEEESNSSSESRALVRERVDVLK